MPIFQAKVNVSLRPSVLDPAGEATRSAANRLGIEGLTKLRIGKCIELEIDAKNEIEAREKIEILSGRLLANPVIEDWILEDLSSSIKSISFCKGLSMVNLFKFITSFIIPKLTKRI